MGYAFRAMWFIFCAFSVDYNNNNNKIPEIGTKRIQDPKVREEKQTIQSKQTVLDRSVKILCGAKWRQKQI